MKSRPAFTIVEFVLSLLLVMIVAVPSIMGFRNIRLKQALSASSEKLVSAFKQAHIFSRESKDNKSWGVKYKDPVTFVLMSGNVSAGVPVFEYPLDFPVEFLSGPFEIWFDQGTGGTANDVSVEIVTPTGARAVVSVSKNGVVEVQ